MNRIFSLIFILVVMLFAQSPQTHFDHKPFDQILQKYVTDGRLNYHTLQKNRSRLEAYLENMEKVKRADLKQWSREEKMTFWINAYNAITIEGILRNYPIHYGNVMNRLRFPKNSIRQIGGFRKTVFVKPLGKPLTLNDIEHKILRKKFKDPRVHFVLVCASPGCPKLQNRAFFAENLEQWLEQAAMNFVGNTQNVQLNKKENVLYLSSIFEWYKDDFTFSGANKTGITVPNNGTRQQAPALTDFPDSVSFHLVYAYFDSMTMAADTVSVSFSRRIRKISKESLKSV
ncbi:MAG TPA: DUF547 domain-containing protein [Caldithrix sp.]|nr:DUF547 domain-containing protein [Caldithrix sp.]